MISQGREIAFSLWGTGSMTDLQALAEARDADGNLIFDTNGGSENDFLTGGAGADNLNGGGGGADIASYLDSDARVEVDLANGTASGGHAQGDILTGIEGVQGSAYNDRLDGDAGANTLLGGDGGDDILDGGAGDDFIRGDAGNDRIFGGDGNDALEGSEGDDRVSGGAGDDAVIGGSGDDNLEGNSGDETSVWADKAYVSAERGKPSPAPASSGA